MGQAVVLVTGADPTTGIGGHGTFVRAHARAAQRAGFEPHIFCWSPTGEVVSSPLGVIHRVELASGLDHLPWFRFRTQKMVWRSRLMARGVAAFLAETPAPRLVHAFGGAHGRTGVEAARRARRQGLEVRTVTSAFDTMVEEARAKFRGVSAASHGWGPRISFGAEFLLTRLVVARFERRAYAEADRVLVNYESVRRALSRLYAVADKVIKVPYSSETAFLRAGGSSRWLRDGTAGGHAEPLVVAVSRHDPRKGLDVLIRALARLHAAGVKIRGSLLGGGSLLAAHRRLAERLGLAGVVRVEGFVRDAAPYLEEAHAFVQPSLEEGSGSLSVLEALQMGTPVIASGVDGIPEDVTDGESGLLVPPGDVEALAAALRRVLEDDPLRLRLARAGHAVFASRFSGDTFAAGLRDAYATVGIAP